MDNLQHLMTVLILIKTALITCNEFLRLVLWNAIFYSAIFVSYIFLQLSGYYEKIINRASNPLVRSYIICFII